MDNGITPVMPVGGMDNGFGGGNAFVWIFGLLILMGMMGGGGFGWGGNGNGNSNAIQNDINRGFDSQNLQAQTRDILAAVNAQGQAGIAATNATFHDSLAVTQNLYNELARDIAGLAVGQSNLLAKQAECCCETKQLIMQSNYDGALRDAATNANFTAQIQSVKDMIAQDKIEALQNQVNALQLQNAVAGVVRYPTMSTYTSGGNPFCGCGCGA